MVKLKKATRKLIELTSLLILGFSAIQIAQGFFGLGTLAQAILNIQILTSPFKLVVGDILGFLALLSFVWRSGVGRGGIGTI